jgi:hypothetical protein
MGVRMTIFRTKNHYFWPKMSGDVARYVRGSETCQKVKLTNIGPYLLGISLLFVFKTYV